MVWKENIDQSFDLIKDEVRRTPIEYSHVLSELTGGQVYLKLENYQLTGSFKIRGVTNKILRLSKKEIENGLVACSTGNHGAAFAHRTQKMDCKSILFVPENITNVKLNALKQYDIEIRFHGTDCVDTEEFGGRYALEHGMTLVHPYNDRDVVCGQGTIAKEVIEQMSELPEIMVAPVGGGGLISGLAAYCKALGGIKVFGCQPVNSPVMYESLKAGKIVNMVSNETISDATAGGIEAGSITFDISKRYLDGIWLATEDEILNAIGFVVDHHQMIIDGASAMTVAYARAKPEIFKGKNTVLIISGKKLTTEHLRKALK